MIYRETLDKAKQRAHEHTGIPIENMMASATHTHSSGTACSVFQSDPDPEYLEFLRIRIADAIIRANHNLAPARIAWGSGLEPSQVFNRRWKLKAGADAKNPFGGMDKVRMNPGFDNPDVVEPAGPIDPEVPVVCVQSLDGKPIGLLANYSLHYVGGTGGPEVSADYYGIFGERMAELIGGNDSEVPFLAMMSNGTSGDINNVNYGGTRSKHMDPYAKMKEVANVVAAEVYKVYQNLEFKDWVELSSAQSEITLSSRRPDAQELQRAKDIMAAAEGPNMKTIEEIYARETVHMNEFPAEEDLILQAFRIGDLAIAAIPCEVFVEIGLKIKAESPIAQTFTISLANGYNGYLPTPQHHAWGGYETWRARSSHLEVEASVKIEAAIMDLLNQLK